MDNNDSLTPSRKVETLINPFSSEMKTPWEDDEEGSDIYIPNICDAPRSFGLSRMTHFSNPIKTREPTIRYEDYDQS